VRPSGLSQAQTESYGTPVFESPERGPHGRGQLMVQQSGGCHTGLAVPMCSAVQAMQTAGK
jgi:hypothetical protein